MTTLELGGGDIDRHGVGSKAAMLDTAAAAGLPVPPGFVVLHGNDTARAAARIDASTLVVRSAFSAEDGATASMAGRFHSVLGVDNSPEVIDAALAEVRKSASVLDADERGSTRLDALVMTQVDARVSGVAFTEQQFEDDLVNMTTGLADGLVSGATAGDRSTLPKLRWWEKPSADLPPWAQRLSRLLADVRETFGQADWDIEWADDGTTCWLVQVRPITAAPQRNEAFTIANHKEILPELPSTLMTSVIERCSSDLLAFWADADPSLPVSRPFVETFVGRPYLNLSMLTDMMRVIGLPTRLVTDSYGGEPDVDVGLRPLRLLAKTPTLLKLARAQLGAVGSADAAGRAVRDAVPAAPTFTATLECFGQQYTTLVSEMSSLASAMVPPSALLTSVGALDAHLARHRTAATAMLDRLAPVRAALATGASEGDPDFDAAWQTWLDHHGHRGVFESDIARPRFRDDPTPILAAAAAPALPAPVNDSSSLLRVLTSPLWWAARRAMTAREDLRDRSMRGFAATRDRLLALADAAVARGALPDRDAIWELTVDELRRLDTDGSFSADAIAERRRRRDELLARRLPDTVRRFDDLDAPVDRSSVAGDTFRGLSLTKGTVRGRAFRASEPPTSLPSGFDPESTILVARSVDAGWVPIFGQVAGVAVEIGGDLSHGSIVLRELGLPAVTNLGEIGAAIETGDDVEIRAGAGVLALVGDRGDG